MVRVFCLVKFLWGSEIEVEVLLFFGLIWVFWFCKYGMLDVKVRYSLFIDIILSLVYFVYLFFV